jgi:hypothetical protein
MFSLSCASEEESHTLELIRLAPLRLGLKHSKKQNCE